jgi:hypothetical protein
MNEKAQWVTFLTVLAGFIFQFLREGRRHKWDERERATKAKADADRAAAIAKQATQTAVIAASERAEIKDAIAANTEVSTQAFKEANSINLKIHNLGLEQKDHNELVKKDTDGNSQV